MRHPLYVFSTVAYGLVAPLVAHAAQDPSESFLNAFMSVRKGDELEASGRYKEALAKFRYAGSLLDQIHEQHPEWQAMIVEYRRKKTAESISRMEQKVALDTSAEPADTTARGLPTTPSPDAGVDLSDPNGLALPFEGGLPAQTPAPSSARGRDEGGDEFDKAASKMRQQMRKLREDLQEALSELSQVRKEKTEISTQLQAALNQVSAFSASAQGGELERVRAEAVEAKTKLDQAHANEKALTEQLAKAKEELADPGVQEKKFKTALAKAEKALADAKADREVAEEQGEILTRKLAKLAEVTKENEKLGGKLTDAQKKIQDLQEVEKRLVADRDAQKVENTELSAKLAETQKKMDAQATELVASEQKLVAMVQERETALKERDTALSELAKGSQSKAEVERLVSENGVLMQKLDEAQKTIASFKSGASTSEADVLELKQKLVSVESHLATALQENQQSKGVIEGLQKQLDTIGKNESVALPEEQKKLSEENDLLRGIVMRELKDQARREQARKLISSELSRLQVRSETLNEQVELLSQPVVQLSEKERALFKVPQMQIVDNESNSLAIAISAPLYGTATEGTGGDSASVPGVSSITAKAPSSGAGQGKTSASSSGGGLRPVADSASKASLSIELQAVADKAKVEFDAGRFKDAAKVYERLVANAPNNIYSLSNLGVAYFRGGSRKQAEETFKKVITLAPDHAFSYATLGIIYFQQGKHDDAVKALTRSLAINPKNPTAHNYLGVTAAQKGWAEAAQKEIETAIQLDPSYGDAHFNLAVVLATNTTPNKEKARRHYKKAVALGAAKDKGLEELLK